MTYGKDIVRLNKKLHPKDSVILKIETGLRAFF
jgi:hypothetical protein